MRSFICLIVTTLLITSMVACSGGGGGGSTSSSEPSAPADSTTPADTAAPKPVATSDSGATDNPVNNGVTIVEKPTATTPPTASDIPASTPVEKQQETPAAPPQEIKPDPMVANITAPLAGSLWSVHMLSGYETQVFLTGTSNKKDATYTWTVFDAKKAPVEIEKDANGAPFFRMKTAGTHTITLAGTAPDGTSNSVSVEVTGTAPSLADAKLTLLGLTDGGSYPLGASYPLTASSYSDGIAVGNYQYTWKLLKAPQGSNATISGADHSATFSPDIEGAYQIAVAIKNAADETEQKSISVFLLPTKMMSLWSPLFGGLTSLFSKSASEMYAGTADAVFKYGTNKQWLPILSDPSGTLGTYSIARVSDKEVYFGGKGYILKYNGVGFTKIALPTEYTKYHVTSLSATTGNVWAVVVDYADPKGRVLHLVGNEFVLQKDATGSDISGKHVITLANDLVVVTERSDSPSYVFMGNEMGWKILAKTDSNNIVFDKCIHGIKTNPIICISSNGGRIYTMSPDDNTGFGPLTHSDSYEPLPTQKIADFSKDDVGNLLILDKTGQFFHFDSAQNKWEKTANIISPSLDTNLSNLGMASPGAPALINGSSEVFRFDVNHHVWEKENLPSAFRLGEIYKIPNGPIWLVGQEEPMGGTPAGVALVFDPTQHIITKKEPIPLTGVSSVFATSPQDIWALGQDLHHFDGSSWSKIAIPPEYIIDSSYTKIGNSADGKTIYMTGQYNGQYTFIEIKDAGTVSAMTSDKAPYSIVRFVTLDAHIYAFGWGAGDSYRVWQLDPTLGWKTIGSAAATTSGEPGYFNIYDGVAIAPNDITIAGVGGAKHFNGEKWNDENADLPDGIYKLSTVNGDVFGLVGKSLYKRDAKTATWIKVNDLTLSNAMGAPNILFMLDPLQYIYGKSYSTGVLNFVGVVGQ